jgi:ABC-type phosphate/phosphonate transport system ATPase subunit
MPLLNPFLYGKPVPPARFVGRRDAVRTLFSRLYNGESTAIVGEPHIGKSSLLRYVMDDDVRAQ